MKIIGKREYGFIVDIEDTELEKLTGYYYGKKEFSIGEELQIHALYDQLTAFSTQGYDIEKLSHTLKTAAGMLEKIDPVFSKSDEDD